MRVLLVEDNKLVSKIWRSLFEREGVEVSIAENGEQAIKVCQTEKPDVVLLDIVVPGMHGFEIIQTLKMFDETKNIPVIFLTSLNRDEDRQRAAELGAMAYFVKSPHVFPQIIKFIKEKVSDGSHSE